MVVDLKTKDEFKKALNDAGDKVVAVDFTASWCGPCKMIGPKFVEFANEFKEMLFYKVDVDENSETAEAEGISAMPTFKFYKNGAEIGDMMGADENKLKQLCEKYNKKG